MGNKASATRERILQQGLEMLSRDGLSGVTLGQMAERVGMSKSGLFAHFRSKDDVQIDLLEHSAKLATVQVVEPAMAATEGLPRLEALVYRWFGWAQKAGLPGGCPAAAAMFELDDVEGPVRDKVAAMEAEWKGFLSQITRQAVALGHLRPDLDVEQFVWELSGIYLSHHVAHRFNRSPDADERAHTAFQALLERARPWGKRPRLE
jgi:AcrR family transcriptional regulator